MKIGKYTIQMNGFKVKKISKVIDNKQCKVYNIVGIGIIKEK